MADSTMTFLDGGGTSAELIRTFAWAGTSLGPIDGWPTEMTTAIGLALRTAVPIALLWGPDGVMIYNDAYARVAGSRHPGLLGAKVLEAWPEVAAFNDHVMRTVLGGETLSYVDQELVLNRQGVPEQAWMNLDYSPIRYRNGVVAGVMAVVIETTAKVRAERRAQGEQHRLAAMFEQAPGLMTLMTGPEHRLEFVNAACRELIGNRDVIGLTMREAFPELEEQGFIASLDHAHNSGEPVIGLASPVLLEDPAGGPARLRYVDFIYQPLKSEDGSVFGIFSQGTDVTERMLAEASLRESESKFRMFAQAMPHHVWTTPADGKLDWCNERLHEYAGTRFEQIEGDTWASIVHEEDLPLVQERWNESLTTGTNLEVELRLRRSDGVYRWHLARAVPMKDEGGKVTRWIGSNTDIEDQKSTADSLARLNATLEEQVSVRTAERDRIWRLSKDIMLVADFNGALSSVNPAFTSTLGWREHEVIGKSLIDLLHPEDIESTRAQIGMLSGGSHVFRFQNRYRRKDGSYCTLSWTAVPDAGHIHAVGRDITSDLAQAEVMRKTEAALQQAQKMETIGKLTGGVAHDFNNLLQVISGNLQLMAPQVQDNSTCRRRLENALSSVERGAKLASSLLAFARKQPLEPKVVKLSKLVAGMEDMLRRSLGEEIEIETVVSGGLWNTSVDVTQVENAILNLAINARDAMDGNGRLTLEVNNALLDSTYCAAHPDVSPGQYVMIAISDTGSGMTPDVIQRAFEPFFSTKPEGKGTGLGLSMVYGLVKQSGGHIKIYSEVGEGTTIKLYLPRSRENEDSYVVLNNQPVVGGSETVLVVEDDDQVRATAVELLKELGYRVLKAGDASAALTVIDSGVPIDLLFTDVVMPGPLRSPELARKAKERLPQVAVLFTSGYTENAIVHGGKLDQGVELIGKPYTKELLARKIRHVLANEKQKHMMASEPASAPAPVPAPAPAQAQVGQADVGGKASGCTVLFVEDDADIRSTTRDAIEFLGHEVIAVASAEEAMLQLSGNVDILLTDMQLPGIQGSDLAQVARAQFPRIKVLLASGFGQAAAIPGVELLPKPYTLDMLRTALSLAKQSA